jgi:hypothetical protein
MKAPRQKKEEQAAIASQIGASTQPNKEPQEEKKLEQKRHKSARNNPLPTTGNNL